MSAALPDLPTLPGEWHYPAELPICGRRNEILQALRREPVLILCGATGSGKSTQLPKLCLEAGRGQHGQIAHTQPRRLAARALAERVAAELKTEVGGLIGWQVRFKAVLSADTRVKFLTDGVLLNELRHDPQLRRYDTVIIDEAHERSLNIDFLLGCLQRLRRQRPDLKLIITSATLDAEKFSRHFDGAPVIDVAGRSHPIELRYREPAESEGLDALAEAVREIWHKERGDILIFLPGEREIREAAAHLQRSPALSKLPTFQTLPLFARLGSARQQAIFQPGKTPRLILATNIAETSLTVPGIRHVIDTGSARVSRYSPRSQLQTLALEPISRASADQRKGRCGREAPGICIRLYAEEDYAARPAHTDPEIQRTNLAAVLLQMADLKLGQAEDFPFVDAPPDRLLRDARRLLRQLAALDEDGGLTPIGRELARLPIDPRFGRMLLAGRALGAEDATVILAAVLSIQDPRLRHADIRDKADAAQAEFRDERSDFQGLLTLWHSAQDARKALGSAAYRRWCDAHYLHHQRLQEWRDLVRQLRGIRKLTPGPVEVDGPRLHQAVLSGLLDHIGRHESEGEFQGPRGSAFRIHPESGLRKRRPRWIVAAELLHTGRSYGRVVAAVEPEWIETAAGDQVQRRALDPAWDRRQGAVMAREEVSLYGLVLHQRRRVPYARFEPDAARRLFITEALVRGDWGRGQRPAFLDHFGQLRDALLAEEARLRRRDLLRDEEELIAWFDARLPPSVRDRRSLLRKLSGPLQERLQIPEQDLRSADGGIDEAAYPPQLELAGQRYPLQYHFDPGADDDGVNLQLPLAALNTVPTEPLDWLVPGFLDAKIDALLRGLPKARRRAYVPIRDAVNRCRQQLRGEGDLFRSLNRALQQAFGVAPGEAALRAVELPPRLKMRIVVRDDRQQVVGAGRDLTALQARLASSARRQFQALDDARWQRDGLQAWDFGDLPDQVRLGNGVTGYPHLADKDGEAALRLADDPARAAAAQRAGQLRLLLQVQARRLRELVKNLPERKARLLQAVALPSHGHSGDDPVLAAFPLPDLAWACAARAVAERQSATPLRRESDFQAALEAGAGELPARLQAHWQQLGLILARWQALREPLTGLERRGVATVTDMREQLADLLAPGFVLSCPRLADLPRYLQALLLRAERAAHDPATDAARLAEFAPYGQRWRDALEKDRNSPALREYRWMLEEFRISLFAQTVKTRIKISPKRLDKAWEACR